MGLPFKPNDWVADSGENIARVRRIYVDRNSTTGADEILFDLVMYDRNGDKVGRISPAMGGPRSFEPACPISGWRRIAEPSWPVQVMSVPDPKRPGRSTMRYYAGPTLPPANYTPRKTKPRASSKLLRAYENNRFRLALMKIADGDNDARAVAKKALGR